MSDAELLKSLAAIEREVAALTVRIAELIGPLSEIAVETRNMAFALEGVRSLVERTQRRRKLEGRSGGAVTGQWE